MRKIINKTFGIGLSLCLMMTMAFGCGKSNNAVTEKNSDTDTAENSTSKEESTEH
ncbi:MAG: hypothetical protein IIY49_00845 [Eubacterium sp.]|nr:hypothetical protein [Eubacterium sp.]